MENLWVNNQLYIYNNICIFAVPEWHNHSSANLWHQTNHPSLIDVTTVEAWITMPKSASYHPSPKSATFVRASNTWLPAAQSNHSSHHQVLRGNSLHWKETKGSTVTWWCLANAPIKQVIRKHSFPGGSTANKQLW